jgi:hypothetical protein
VEDSFWSEEGRLYNFEDLLEECVINNRGISSLDEHYEAGGRQDEVHIYFDLLGVKRRMYFGGEPVIGGGSSELHLSTKQPEQ